MTVIEISSKKQAVNILHLTVKEVRFREKCAQVFNKSRYITYMKRSSELIILVKIFYAKTLVTMPFS